MKKNILLIFLFLQSISDLNAQVDFIWGKQFGTDKDDKTRDLVVDSSSNVYVVGKTKGVIGKENFGKNDGFIVKIDSAANTIWSIQIGSIEDDEFTYVTVDKSGNIYASGFMGVAEKNKSTKNQDILVVKLNSDGEIIWQKQYGTDSTETAGNIVVDTNGDIYIAGSTKGVMASDSKGNTDCIILHLNNNGDKMNIVQFGTSGEDLGTGITIGHNGKIYVSGSTTGNMAADNLGQFDLFWGCFSKKLQQQEMTQYGTNESDHAGDIKTDYKNNIYFAGCTFGDAATKQKGKGDALIQKWNENGELIWQKQFGTSNWDGTHGIAIIQDKGIIASGCYDYPFCKSFIKMYDENGTLLWNRNIIGQGKGGGSCGKEICVNSQGYIYHAGYTGANLFANLSGEHDLFLVKLKADKN